MSALKICEVFRIIGGSSKEKQKRSPQMSKRHVKQLKKLTSVVLKKRKLEVSHVHSL